MASRAGKALTESELSCARARKKSARIHSFFEAPINVVPPRVNFLEPLNINLLKLMAALSLRDLDKKQISDATKASDETLRYVMPIRLSLSKWSRCGAMRAFRCISSSVGSSASSFGALSSLFLKAPILPLDSQFFRSESLTTSSTVALLAHSDAAHRESRKRSESEAQVPEPQVKRAFRAEQKDRIDVELSEITKACGYCELGRPIDLWNNKMLPPALKNALQDDSQLTHERNAAPLCAKLYKFLTGNACEPPDCKWPPELKIVNECEKSLVWLIDQDKHESNLANGYLIFYTPLEWGAKSREPSDSMEEPRMHDLLLAHLLLSTSEEPAKAWVDILHCAFEKGNYDNELFVADPIDKNISLTRVYYSDNTIARKIVTRIREFTNCNDASQVLPWMRERAHTASLQLELVQKTNMAKPHSFLCDGEYETNAQWRRCLQSALANARHRKRSQLMGEGAAVFLPNKRKEFGEPYLYLASAFK